MKNKGTKRKKHHESTKVVRRKTKHSKPQLEPELFRDLRELEDLWKHAYPVGTELDRLDKLYEYNWNFSNLEEAFDKGGVLHREKVYLFVCTEGKVIYNFVVLSYYRGVQLPTWTRLFVVAEPIEAQTY
ncbi:heat intolerant 4-like protein [Tanacetum coccineum]